MSRSFVDDLFDDTNTRTDNKSAARGKSHSTHDDLDDDWFGFAPETKKSTTTTTSATLKRQDTVDDGADGEDGWNRTGGSNASYIPSFGGPTGTMTNTLSGQDTLQRIINQPRPATASGSRNFDDLFGSSPPKTSTLGDTAKTKKTVSFDDTEARPSIAPSQNRSNPSVLSSLRTGLEPNRSFDNFPSTKAPTDSNNDNSWLGLKGEPTDEDEEVPPLPPQAVRVAPRAESAVSTLVKKTPLATAQPVPAAVIEPPKKSLFDLLDDDRKQLHEKTILPANVTSTAVKAPDNWLDDRNTTNKRPPAAPLIKPSESQSPMKSSIKSSFDTRNDFADITFKDSIFPLDQPSSLGTRTSNSTVNLDMKRYEFENNELKMTLDHIKRQHETEVAMLDEGYKHRLEYVEKSCERREARLKDENEHLLRQLNDRTQQYESDKAALLLDHQRRLDDLQRDRTNELENLRTLQRQTVDHLRREHEQTIQRLKQLKQEEISTALDVTTHTRAFESVVDHMEQNVKNIDDLRLKIEAKHSSALTDRDIETRAKANQLKAYEERLHSQASDFERERKNLQELISRLEVHLSEQTKLVEEERWKSMQAQKRMEAMQDALNGEQRLYTDKIARDRMEIQRSKEQVLEDQKAALASIYESRSQLAEDRARVEALQKSFQDQKHRDVLQTATIEAETRAQQKLAAEQLARLEKREQDLMKREEGLLLEKRSLAELKQRLESEQSSVKHEHEEVKSKLIELDHTGEQIKKEKERLAQIYFDLHALDGKSTGRLQQLQRSVTNLRQQEEQMSEKYSRAPNERGTLRSTLPPPKASSTFDSGFSTLQSALNTPLMPINAQQRTLDERNLSQKLNREALQDQLYIEREMAFLHRIRASGHHLSSRSASLSNLHRHPESNLLRTIQ